jgi:hypothetical protein
MHAAALMARQKMTTDNLPPRSSRVHVQSAQDSEGKNMHSKIATI